MKSVLCHQATLQVVDQPNFNTRKGQVLLEVVDVGSVVQIYICSITATCMRFGCTCRV